MITLNKPFSRRRLVFIPLVVMFACFFLRLFTGFIGFDFLSGILKVITQLSFVMVVVWSVLIFRQDEKDKRENDTK